MRLQAMFLGSPVYACYKPSTCIITGEIFLINIAIALAYCGTSILRVTKLLGSRVIGSGA